MIAWLAAIFLAAGLVILVRLFKLPEKSRAVLDTARRSLAVIRSASLTDADKEAALQKDARHLFGLFIRIALGGGAAVFLPVALVWLLSRTGLISLDAVWAVAFSPAFLILSGALALLALWPARPVPADNRYSGLDRLLHRLAFGTYATQIPLADLETRLYAAPLAACKADRPVFITALPRAGTTLLLECCARLPDFASHCYRDMPFVLTPCLWSRFSASFQKGGGGAQPRAHGDGMLIDLDSPEALEEVLWTAFWKPHYRADRILPWGDEEQPPFAAFFRDHMRKIILLRRGHATPTARYITKNNGNIARTGWLRRQFPEAVILVPFREPVHHAASLLEQHLNFLRIHEQDPFAAAYMKGIGHFDFGRNLRPIDFQNWLDRRLTPSAQDLAFWLEYWTACYGHLLQASEDRLLFLHYDRFCENPGQGLQALGAAIGTRHPDPLLSAAPAIRPARARAVDTGTVPPPILQEAGALYDKLKQVAQNGSDSREP